MEGLCLAGFLLGGCATTPTRGIQSTAPMLRTAPAPATTPGLLGGCAPTCTSGEQCALASRMALAHAREARSEGYWGASVLDARCAESYAARAQALGRPVAPDNCREKTTWREVPASRWRGTCQDGAGAWWCRNYPGNGAPSYRLPRVETICGK